MMISNAPCHPKFLISAETETALLRNRKNEARRRRSSPFSSPPHEVFVPAGKIPPRLWLEPPSLAVRVFTRGDDYPFIAYSPMFLPCEWLSQWVQAGPALRPIFVPPRIQVESRVRYTSGSALRKVVMCWERRSLWILGPEAKWYFLLFFLFFFEHLFWAYC